MRLLLPIAFVLLFGCGEKNTTTEVANTTPLVTPPEDVTAAVHALLPQPNLPQLHQAVKWQDAGGQNWLILYESGPFRAAGNKESAVVAVVLFVKTDSGFVQQWSFSDTIAACSSGANLRYYPGHLSVADADTNGYTEVTIVYEQGCAAAAVRIKKLVIYEQGRQLQYEGPVTATGLPRLLHADTIAIQPAIAQHLQAWWQRFPAGVQ